MPIYEFKCNSCGLVFERLELKIVDTPTSQCPICAGVGARIMSAPAIVYETFNERAIQKLPDWHEKQIQAEANDRRVRSRMLPLDHDRGKEIKVYQTEFGKTERTNLESKAQLDNV